MRQKQLYRAKNGQFLETHLFSAVQEKEKPHRYEGAFRGVWATFRISKQLLAKGNEYLSHAKNYFTKTFRVASPNFTKHMPCGNSKVSFPSISRVKMVCPREFVTVIVPVPSMVKRPLAGLG